MTKTRTARNVENKSRIGSYSATGLALVALLSLSPLPAPAKKDMPERQSGASTVLEGGISHLESLPPVALELRTGQKFDTSQLPAYAQTTETPANSLWFRVPSWLAGDWQIYKEGMKVKGDTVVSTPQKTSILFGQQADASGQIWHWEQVPRRIEQESEGTYSVFLIHRIEMSQRQADEFVVHTVWTGWDLDKGTRKILSVHQVDQIDIMRAKVSGDVRGVSFLGFYDVDGRFMESMKQKRKLRLKSAFRPLDTYHDMDLKSSFAEFMAASGKRGNRWSR